MTLNGQIRAPNASNWPFSDFGIDRGSKRTNVLPLINRKYHGASHGDHDHEQRTG
jgi:hypothetical protein